MSNAHVVCTLNTVKTANKKLTKTHNTRDRKQENLVQTYAAIRS